MKWSEINPMDSSLQGSSVHGIFQARILEWVAIYIQCLKQGSENFFWKIANILDLEDHMVSVTTIISYWKMKTAIDNK